MREKACWTLSFFGCNGCNGRTASRRVACITLLKREHSTAGEGWLKRRCVVGGYRDGFIWHLCRSQRMEKKSHGQGYGSENAIVTQKIVRNAMRALRSSVQMTRLCSILLRAWKSSRRMGCASKSVFSCTKFLKQNSMLFALVLTRPSLP